MKYKDLKKVIPEREIRRAMWRAIFSQRGEFPSATERRRIRKAFDASGWGAPFSGFFFWGTTPEGHDFWKEISDRFQK